MIALVVAAGMNIFTYWNSDKMVLSMAGAQEVDARTAPDLYNMVAELAQRAQLPMPKVYLMDEAQPNAFATGRNPENAAVAVTTGLLERLSQEEVAGVVAHELAHIKNHDTLIMTITATIAGAISMLAQFGMFFGGNRDSNSGGGGMGIIGTLAMVILAPIAAMLVQMAISRTREYSADKLGAQICRSADLARVRARARSPMPRTRSRTSTPNAIRGWRICSSSTRCRASGWTTCSRPIRRPKTGSRRWRNWRARWARVQAALAVVGRRRSAVAMPAPRRAPAAACRRPARGRAQPVAVLVPAVPGGDRLQALHFFPLPRRAKRVAGGSR